MVQEVIANCKKCGYKWNYKGTKKVQATCPDCHKLVKL